MDVRNCKGCGTLFNYVSGPPLCSSCMKALDDKFGVVKQYIYDHPGAGMQEVSDENEVPIPIIKKWIKEERLTFAEGSTITLDCERCGASILSGRFCQKCKDAMGKQLGSAYATPKPQPEPKKADTEDKARMRFLK